MADPIKIYNLPVFKEIRFPIAPYHIVPCASRGFLAKYRNSALVSRFDADYNLLWEQNIGDRLNSFTLSISSDGSMIGVSGIDFVRIFDSKGQLLFNYPHFRREIYQSSECYFHVDDSGKISRFLFFEPSGNEEGFLQVFDAANFTLIKSLPWQDIHNHFEFYRTPHSNRILINLLAGQDGSRLLLAMLVDNKVLVAEQEQCDYLAMINFSPGGDEFAGIQLDDQCLNIYSFPDMEQIATLDGEQIFTADNTYPAIEADSYEYIANYLSCKIILVRTRFGRLLLINRDTLQPFGELTLEQCSIIGYDEYGKATSNPDEIIDYASEAEQIFLTNNGHLFAIHTNGNINVYKLPDFT